MPQPVFRQLVESEDYLDQHEKLGSVASLDEALRALYWSLTVRAEVWPVVPGFKRLRLAYTDMVESRGRIKHGLRIWFEIRDEHTVDLLYLERDDTTDF